MCKLQISLSQRKIHLNKKMKTVRMPPVIETGMVHMAVGKMHGIIPIEVGRNSKTCQNLICD